MTFEIAWLIILQTVKGVDEDSSPDGKVQRAGDGGKPVRVKRGEDHFRAAEMNMVA